MYQLKAMRLVTFDANEYLIVAKDPSYLDKILPFIHSLNPQIQHRNQSILELSKYQERWVKGVISNAEYLLYLNFVGNRSFNDLTQYPVFPWVIADYKNDKIELDGSKNAQFLFRDLGKPIGSLNPDKLEQFRSKYFEIINKASNVLPLN
jgi:Beige/BEACH domain